MKKYFKKIQKNTNKLRSFLGFEVQKQKLEIAITFISFNNYLQRPEEGAEHCSSHLL